VENTITDEREERRKRRGMEAFRLCSCSQEEKQADLLFVDEKKERKKKGVHGDDHRGARGKKEEKTIKTNLSAKRSGRKWKKRICISPCIQKRERKRSAGKRKKKNRPFAELRGGSKRKEGKENQTSNDGLRLQR